MTPRDMQHEGCQTLDPHIIVATAREFIIIGDCARAWTRVLKGRTGEYSSKVSLPTGCTNHFHYCLHRRLNSHPSARHHHD